MGGGTGVARSALPSSQGLTVRSPQLLAAWEGFCSPQLALGCTHLYRDTPLGVALGPGNVQLGRAPSRDVSQPRGGTALVPSKSATGLGTRPSPTAQAPAPISAPSVCQQIAQAANMPPSRPYRTLPLCSISEKPHSSSQQWPCCLSAAHPCSHRHQGHLGHGRHRPGTAPLPAAGTRHNGDLALPGHEPRGSQLL